MSWSNWIQSPDYTEYAEVVNPGLSSAVTSVGPILTSYWDYYISPGMYDDHHLPSLSPLHTGSLMAAVHARAVSGEGYTTTFPPDGGSGVLVTADVWYGYGGWADEDGGIVMAYWALVEIAAFAQSVSSWRAAPIWLEIRDWRPSLLHTLVERVDYDYIPDTTDFVQYENAPNVFIGWADWNIVHGVRTPGASYVTVRLGYSNGERHWGSEGPGWLDHMEGDYLATLPGGHDGTLVTTVSLAPLGNMTSWTLYQQPNWLVSPIPEVEVDISAGNIAGYDSANGLAFSRPQFTYRMPRYRYWIPERSNLSGESTGTDVYFTPIAPS
jgi:hypothetical protein